jgi:DNA-binding CsgD family transcriptional regulator
VFLTSLENNISTLLFNAICFSAGAIILFVVYVQDRLDFNQLIYLLGFPLMSLGLLLVVVVSGWPITGCVLVFAGYAFVHIVMCGVNAYLGKQFSIPMPWILSWTTCCFMLGQAVGALLGYVLSTLAGVPFYYVVVCCLFVLLAASAFMIDNRNMKYGWGVIKMSSTAAPSLNTIELACQFIATDFNLSGREAEVLMYLSIGRSRKFISEKLFVTEETVKSHIHSIYQKLDVHTKEEFIAVIQKQAENLSE